MHDLRKLVKQRRTERGLTQGQLAKAIRVSASLVASIENGRLVPQPDTAERLDSVLEADGAIIDAANAAREDAMAPWLRPWTDHEQQATMIRTWEPTLIPGLLQTEAYARAVLGVGPHTPAQVDEMTAKRLARQAATLDRDPPVTLSAIVGEPALRYGDPVLLRGQLNHLLKLGERPGVGIRVIPFSAGIHPGLTGAFAVATLAGRRPVGYLDDQLRGRVVADADDLATLEWTWEALSGRALPIEQTRELIGRLVHEHR
ncbi:helix-turn-helix transcriptional regulator [Micromonospora sp. HM5-17]|uniref:helix-turn-helix domain-containing protein n=1 Tax=Micromonospora sp. HM5-17 TaxID=2487710 RepID=UPI000F46E2DE|nr:helix-turn-helix transcriptional regulator [Micromonospora sp. HM5-17]ROT33986.1 XRE family transcriptional regulator [Micromonospora sp. HM5-17]